MQPGDALELDIERPAFGGDVLARAPDGRVVFLRGAAPGDRVRATVTQARRRFLRAEVVEIVAGGPERVAPFCAHFERCGGCPWQAVAPAAQQAALADHVERLVRRLDARAEVAPLWSSPVVRGWRATARLHWADGALGYHGAGGRDLVDVDACPVLAPEAAALLVDVRALLGPYLRGRGTLRITAAPGAGSGTVTLAPEVGGGDLAGPLRRLVAESARCHGAVLRRKGRPDLRVGAPVDLLGPAAVPHPAGSFVQAHQAGNAALVAAVVEAVAGSAGGGGPVLELFAGSGNFTFALAEAGVEVVAVEADVEAVAALSAGASARGLEGRIRARAGDAAHLPDGAFSTALVDPPRAGAAEAVAALHRAGVARLVYVSCDPATFERDARALVERGWRVARARAFDLFPHTGHVELVAVLTRALTVASGDH